jgi:hypothetical protein
MGKMDVLNPNSEVEKPEFRKRQKPQRVMLCNPWYGFGPLVLNLGPSVIGSCFGFRNSDFRLKGYHPCSFVPD